MEKKQELLGKKYGKESLGEMVSGFKKWVLWESRENSRRCKDLEIKRESIVESSFTTETEEEEKLLKTPNFMNHERIEYDKKVNTDIYLVK